MYEYRCEVCGCYLDPGEGRVCEECLRDDRRKPMNIFCQALDGECFEQADDIDGLDRGFY